MATLLNKNVVIKPINAGFGCYKLDSVRNLGKGNIRIQLSCSGRYTGHHIKMAFTINDMNEEKKKELLMMKHPHSNRKRHTEILYDAKLMVSEIINGNRVTFNAEYDVVQSVMSFPSVILDDCAAVYMSIFFDGGDAASRKTLMVPFVMGTRLNNAINAILDGMAF